MVDGTMPQHFEVLGVMIRLGLGVVEGMGKADPFDRGLRNALDVGRGF